MKPHSDLIATSFFIFAAAAAGLISSSSVFAETCYKQSGLGGDAWVNVNDDNNWLPSEYANGYSSLTSFNAAQNGIDQCAQDLIGAADLVYINYACFSLSEPPPGAICEMYAVTEDVQNNFSPLYSPDGLDVDLGSGSDISVSTQAYSFAGVGCNGYISDVYFVVRSPMQVSVTVTPSETNTVPNCGDVTFTASVNGGSGCYSYSWDDGSTGPSDTRSTTNAAPGVIGAVVTVTDTDLNDGSFDPCTASGSNFVQILPPDPWIFDDHASDEFVTQNATSYTNYYGTTDNWTTLNVSITRVVNNSFSTSGSVTFDILKTVNITAGVQDQWTQGYSVTGGMSYSAAQNPIPPNATVTISAKLYDTYKTGQVYEFGCGGTTDYLGEYTVRDGYNVKTDEQLAGF